MRFKIYASLNTDSLEAWIWTDLDDIASSNIVQIRNTSNRKKISCFSRSIDDNFLRLYNDDKNRFKIQQGDDYKILVMNEFYRRKLNIETQKYYELEIIKIKPWSLIFHNWNHPNLQVQFVNRLTLISILLGIISIFLGLMSIIKTFC